MLRFSPLREARPATAPKMAGLLVVLLAFIAVPMNGGVSADPEVSPVRVPAQCDGEISAPLNITFTTPETAIQPGASLQLQGEVEVLEDVPNLVLRFQGLESASLVGSDMLNLGPATPGQVIPFSIPVQLGTAGRAGVEVTARADAADGSPMYAKREGLYAVMRPTGVMTGRGGFLAVERQALEEDIQLGRVSLDQQDAARAELVRVEGSVSLGPPIMSVPTTLEQDLNEMVGAPRGGYRVVTRGPQLAPGANITVQGNISWTDENGDTHPVWGAWVEIRDEDLIVDELITTVITDQSGNYMASVDDDDGVGQGDRDIYVRVLTENNLIECTDGSLLGSAYQAESGVWDETPGGSVINWNFTAANTGTGPSMSVFQAATWIAAYVAFDAEGADPAKVEVIWPNGSDGSFYDGAVQIEQDDRWDWDTVHHEYGHYVMDFLNIEDNPGGAHAIGDCSANVRGSKSEGNRLAWGEGWPTYFGTSAQAEMNMASLNVPRVGDVSYQDFEDGSLSYSLESQDNNGRGEDNEVAVQRLLWDLYDNNNDGRDNISWTDNTIWNAIKAGAGSPHILDTYWGALRAGQPNATQILMGEIASDHQIGPPLTSPTAGGIASPANNLFSWQAEVGCPSSYSGDQFDLVFYNANTFAKILTIPGINNTQYALTPVDFTTLVAQTHDVLWAVEGYHTPGPSTGPYLGESFAITVNRPPVADAGPDQPNVECASHTTTTVQLDGTGSSDPDGDTITYLWSATGIAFSNATSAMPTGQFPMGTTVVTLTVSDGIEQDTDQVSITVVDTTPPDIICPSDITVECTSHDGTARTDPQLAPFFGGVSATDVCDDSPVITDNAPDYFTLGDTPVTFYATDESGNVDSCTATVTVEDTTPPEIEVVLNRDALWPPNHKMADITATVTVTDICDPNPTYVLTSIVSNEDDDGLGDGDFSNDIQGASYGTADDVFKLRSERMGGGAGRIYTIIYTASDMSGNTTPDTSTVVVPHDQSGHAMPSFGFTADGTWISGGADSYNLIILTGDGFSTAKIDLERAYVGNLGGAIRPLQSTIVDANEDGLLDLLLTYSAEDTRALRSGSNKKYTIGLHYTTGDENYLVSDIFALGSPVRLKFEDGGGDQPDDEVDKVTDGSQTTGEESEIGLQEDEPSDSRWMLRLDQGGYVRVEIFDVQGRLVRDLVNRDLGPGNYDLRWDGADNGGHRVSSGMYFYRVVAPNVQRVQKVVITR